MRKTIFLLLTVGCIFFAVVVYLLYISGNIVSIANNKEFQNKFEMPYETVGVIEADDSSAVESIIDQNSLSAALEKEGFDPQNDKLALEIMHKYGKISASDYIQNREEQTALIRIMCTMYKNSNFSDGESEIIRKYVIQHLKFYKDNPSLIKEFAVMIDYELP